MREESVFRCRWKRTEGGYALWVPRYPFTKIEAPTLDEGCQRICELLLEHSVASFAALELSPRPPIAEQYRQFADPELYLIQGDAPCYSNALDARELFTGTPCERCGTMSGERNARALSLDAAVPEDGGFSSDRGRFFSFFSAEFLAQLTPAERDRLDVRPIRTRGRRTFFELLGPAQVHTVALSARAPNGWHCSACGTTAFGYVGELPIHSFVTREELPDPLPTMFVVGDGSSVRLAATAARWDELRDQRHSRGIISQLLGVVAREQTTQPIVPER